MSKVIVITSGKGGVGKTTSTANIGSALSQLGKKVVIVDADIGLRNLDVVMGLENRIVFDIVDVIEGRCTYQKATIRDKRFETLFLIPAAPCISCLANVEFICQIFLRKAFLFSYSANINTYTIHILHIVIRF